MAEKKPKVSPLHDRVLIRPLEKDEMKKGSIIIPDTAKERPTEGEVVAVGPGKPNEEGDGVVPMSVKPGDKVLYGKYSGTEIEIDGVEYVFLRESDILAVIGKEK